MVDELVHFLRSGIEAQVERSAAFVFHLASFAPQGRSGLAGKARQVIIVTTGHVDVMALVIFPPAYEKSRHSIAQFCFCCRRRGENPEPISMSNGWDRRNPACKHIRKRKGNWDDIASDCDQATRTDGIGNPVRCSLRLRTSHEAP